MPLRDFKTSQSRERPFWRFFVALSAAGVLLFVGAASVKAAWNMYQTFDIAAAEWTAAEIELETLRAEHANVAAVLKEFSSERGLEAAVRARFGVVRPGEGEIRIVRSEETLLTEQEPNTNPFSRLFNALFTW